MSTTIKSKILNTNNTAAQTPSASESLFDTTNGTINLHKVSKTGDYNDLNNKLEVKWPEKEAGALFPTPSIDYYQYYASEHRNWSDSDKITITNHGVPPTHTDSLCYLYVNHFKTYLGQVTESDNKTYNLYTIDAQISFGDRKYNLIANSQHLRMKYEDILVALFGESSVWKLTAGAPNIGQWKAIQEDIRDYGATCSVNVASYDGSGLCSIYCFPDGQFMFNQYITEVISGNNKHRPYIIISNDGSECFGLNLHVRFVARQRIV